MKELRKITILAAMLSIFVLSTTAFAAVYSYDDTVPTFGDKIVVEGTKSSSLGSAAHSTGNCEAPFYAWVDYKNINTNSWVQCTEQYEYYANQLDYMTYNSAVPVSGTEVRLRIRKHKNAILGLGGQRIVGDIHFG